MKRVGLVVLFTIAGCRSGALSFSCVADSQCTAGAAQGICVNPPGVCALPSPSCASGFQYDASAGMLAGMCYSPPLPLDMGTDGPGGNDGPVVSLSVSPSNATVNMGATQQFTASMPVAWSVKEGAVGGKINQAGLYTAPMTAGTYTVVATLSADPQVTASAVVTVTSGPVLQLLAGQLGGQGTIDGVGSIARFENPSYLALDRAGNLYVTDGSVLRKIALATGAVTTLAGSPFSTGTTDAVGTAARFGILSGIAIDAAGAIYVADAGFTIRKITSTGSVSTVAGTAGSSGTADGVGTAAKFSKPQGLAYDGVGSLFVADGVVIREIGLASGTVTTLTLKDTVTGLPPKFLNLAGVVFDSGNLYVTDSTDYTVRQIVLSTGAVTTLAGMSGALGNTDGVGPAARFSFMSGVTSDGAGNLYISDGGPIASGQANQTIRKLVVSTGQVSTFAGSSGTTGIADGTGAAAQFNQPAGIVTDGAGNLYVGDYSNATVRKIVISTRVVSTPFGTARTIGSADGPGYTARFNSPGDVASDGAGNLYVADSSNNTIRKVAADGTVSTLAGTAGTAGSTDGTGVAALFNYPTGLTYDGAGNLYVADDGNQTIRRLITSSGVVTTIAGMPSMKGSTDGTGAAARFNFPYFIAADHSGSLYVSDFGNNAIRKIAIVGAAVSTVAGGTAGMTDGVGSAAQFNGPLGIAIDSANNLYVADSTNNTVRKIDLTTKAVSTLAGMAMTAGGADGVGAAARFSMPGDIAFGGNGNLYVADTGNGTMRKITISSGAVTTPVGVAGQIGDRPGPLPANLNYIIALNFTSPGNVVLVDENAILTIKNVP